LKPLSCSGGQFEPVKLPLVTLIDTLDTLVVMGEYEEFRTAVQLISLKLKSFDFDINVSVFETTIRLLGGLLSAHLMAVDPELSIYVSRFIHYLLSLLLCLRNLTFFCMIYDVNYLLVL
jgi:hypothetical protein